jgi:hypothetical protein
MQASEDDAKAEESAGGRDSRNSFTFEEKLGLVNLLTAIFRIFHSTPNESEKNVGRDELLRLVDKEVAADLQRAETRYRRDIINHYNIASDYVVHTQMFRDAEASGKDTTDRYSANRIQTLWKALQKKYEVRNPSVSIL